MSVCPGCSVQGFWPHKCQKKVLVPNYDENGNETYVSKFDCACELEPGCSRYFKGKVLANGS